MNNITIHKKFSIIINLLHVRFTGFPFYLASLHQLNTAKPALPRSLLARSWTLVWVGLEEQLQSVWAGGDHSKVTVPQILCWGCWWLLLPQCAVCLGFLQYVCQSALTPWSLYFSVCKCTSHMSLLFLMNFMDIRRFYFILFDTPDTGVAQLQVCISFTVYWWAVYSCEVPSVSLCLISYHPTYTPLLCVLSPHSKPSAAIPNQYFCTLHCYSRVINIAVDLQSTGFTFMFLQNREPEVFTISVL